ncbi:MAG: sensor histidine kinase [Acidimicrobiales bacterium]
MAEHRWWRSLLARVTVAYAIGALLLSSTMAAASYLLAENRLLSEAQLQHREQAYFNAIDVRQALLPSSPFPSTESANTAYRAALEGLSRPNRSQVGLLPADRVVRSPTGLTRDQLPEALLNHKSQAVQMMYRSPGGETMYGVAIDLPGVNATYIEVLPLGDLDSTLGSLRVILLGVALVASVAGAGLGYYSARRALAPVARVSSAASAISEGDFTTRLDLQADRDLAQLSTAFNDMVDAVGQRIDREQRFTSDVSHELRSPLMTLTASLEVLERRKESLPEVAQQAVELLSQDLERFQRLVEDLLEISRAEAGALQLEPSEFRLAEFLENVLATTHNVFVPIEYPPRLAGLVVSADKRRLAQVVANLLDNANKYGGGATRVSYDMVPGDSLDLDAGSSAADRLPDRVQIVVEDDGPGVPPHLRDRIFERFGRIDSSAGNRSAATGFGLGLSLVAEHVRLHDGTVWVSDRIDGRHGARFVVELPLDEHALGEDEEMAELAAPVGAARPGGPRTSGPQVRSADEPLIGGPEPDGGPPPSDPCPADATSSEKTASPETSTFDAASSETTRSSP